jgi:YkoP domain
MMASWGSAKQTPQSPHSHPWLAELIFALDGRLRRRHAVVEYTGHPLCVFRLEITRSSRELALRDGTRLRAGQRIAQLHFWNEHVPPVPPNGTTIGWARQMQQGIAISLRELARYLSSRPDLHDILVIGADAPSATRAQSQQLARVMAYYGFEAITEHERLPIGGRMHRFGENILISLTVFAQNAPALRFDTLGRVRLPIFLSRRALEQRFGETAVAP